MGAMAGAVKMLDAGGTGAENHNLGALETLTLPHNVRLNQIKLQMEALPQGKF
jgi:hypothetical protein